MSEFYGADYIYDTLTNNTDVTGIVGSSIYNAKLIPKSDVTSEVINFFRSENINGGQEFFQVDFTINCRAATEPLTLNLSQAVANALNRVYTDEGGYTYFGVLNILPVVEPVTDQDTYNVPILITVRRN